MVKIVIVDTSVLVEKIRMRKGCFDKLIDNFELGRCELRTSSVVLTELWIGASMNFKSSISDIEKILRPIVITAIDGEIGKKAGELIRKKQANGFDALIAATALVYNAELATLNSKHFSNIKGLKLYNENL
jgi:hypothetical protein